MGDRKKKQVDNPSGNYQTSRFNATRHGILSQHTLLPWEPPEVYEELYHSLVQEHTPVGMTEKHLVEELAGIIWRKRRLRIMDISASTQGVSSEIAKQTEDSGLPYLTRLVPGTSFEDFKTMEYPARKSPDEIAEIIAEALGKLKIVQKAQETLGTDKPDNYQAALRILFPKVQQFWDKLTTADKDFRKYEPTPKDLLRFLDEEINPYYFTVFADLLHHGEMMTAFQNITLDMDRMEKMIRYEVFLDRKFERILVMLLKLQTLRREREKIEKVIE